MVKLILLFILGHGVPSIVASPILLNPSATATPPKTSRNTNPISAVNLVPLVNYTRKYYGRLPALLVEVGKFTAATLQDAHSVEALTAWSYYDLLNPEMPRKLGKAHELNETSGLESGRCLKAVPSCEAAVENGLFRALRQGSQTAGEHVHDARPAMVEEGRRIAASLKAKIEEGEAYYRKNHQRRSPSIPNDGSLVSVENGNCVDRYTADAAYAWFIERSKDPVTPDHLMGPLPNPDNVPCLQRYVIDDLHKWYEVRRDNLRTRDLKDSAADSIPRAQQINSTLHLQQTLGALIPYIFKQLSISLAAGQHNHTQPRNSTLHLQRTLDNLMPYILERLSAALPAVWHKTPISQHQPPAPSIAANHRISARQEPQSLRPEEIKILDEYLTDLAANDSVRAEAREHYEYLLEVDRRVDLCLNRPRDWGGGQFVGDGYWEKLFRCVDLLSGYGGLGQEDSWVIDARKKEEDGYLLHLKNVEDGKALAARIAAKLNDEGQTYWQAMDDRLREVLAGNDYQKLRATHPSFIERG